MGKKGSTSRSPPVHTPACCSQHYVCQKRYKLYDTVKTTKNGDIDWVNIGGDPGESAFDIDLAAGALNNKTGICVDLDSSMNEGCGNEVMASIKDGLIGCADTSIGRFLCGLSVEVKHGDLSTAKITGGLGYPRTLISASHDADGDGRSTGELKCTDPIDCVQVRARTHQNTFLVDKTH